MTEATGKTDWRSHGVRIVKASELDFNTPQTPGMTRAAAINFAKAGANKLWAGTVNVQPNAKTGAHHHDHSRASSMWSRAGRGCAGAIDWSTSPRPIQATSSTSHPMCRIRRSTRAPTSRWKCVLVRSDQEPVVVNSGHGAGGAPRGGTLDRPQPPPGMIGHLSPPSPQGAEPGTSAVAPDERTPDRR